MVVSDVARVVQVSTSEAGSAWGLGRVTGWGQRAGQTTKAVGEKVGTSGKTAYRYHCRQQACHPMFMLRKCWP